MNKDYLPVYYVFFVDFIIFSVEICFSFHKCDLFLHFCYRNLIIDA